MEIRLNSYLNLGQSVAAALNQACDELQDGDTLFLGGERLEISADGAFQRYYFISNNDAGNKAIAFPLIGKRNITIDGEGADLVFHGEILPFVVDDSCNVRIQNLSIDYDRPLFSQARIAEAEKGRLVLQFDGNEFCCTVKDNHLVLFSKGINGKTESECALCREFEAETKAPSAYLSSYFFYSGEKKDHGFLSYMYKDVTFTQLAENKIEMLGDLGLMHTPGNMWAFTYADRQYPGIFMNESKDIYLKNIRLFHTPGMGVIGQLSENITLDCVKAVMREGSNRLLTTGADATHFVNCRGDIRIKDCKFVNMMDDACNIHGIYLKDPQKESEYSFTATFGHEQQIGINIFKTGDIVQIIDTENLKVLFQSEVVKSSLIQEDVLQVITKEPVPFIHEGCVAENISTAPNVHISGTESGNNRPRGFLLSSAGKILVENCKFYNISHGINIGGEMLDWYESGAVKDVTIQNNEFCNSAFAGGVAVFIYPKIKNREKAGGFHGKIFIENNCFTMHERRLLKASNVADLRFINNTFICDESLPSQQADNEYGITVENCEKTQIEFI